MLISCEKLGTFTSENIQRTCFLREIKAKKGRLGCPNISPTYSNINNVLQYTQAITVFRFSVCCLPSDNSSYISNIALIQFLFSDESALVFHSNFLHVDQTSRHPSSLSFR